MTHPLITAAQRAELLANGAASGADQDFDPLPVVKLFTPDANATWLLTELDPECPDVAFGLCDLGLGCPEIGSVSLGEIENVGGALGFKVERDLHFVATRPLSEYAEAARRAGAITSA